MNLVWCPSIDNELREQMDKIIEYFPDMHKERLEGGKKQLKKFSPPAKLYILAHGHAEMPLFESNFKKWTAPQFVKLLASDGLPSDWRDIELLVCHAGESVNSVAIGNQLMGIYTKSTKLGKIPIFGANAMKKGRQEYGEVAKRGEKPRKFSSSDQLLPLAAQFTQALKHAGYTNFRVISYAAPVAQNFTKGITLDMTQKGGNWGEPIENHPELVKIWQ